jgi:hypothetical protein
MTYAPRTFGPADRATRNQLALRQCQSPTTKRAPGTSPQYVPERFSGTVAISPPIISVYYRQAPNWGRELFLPGGRPPVNVTCKGGRSPNSARVRIDAWHTDTATSQRGGPYKAPTSRRAVYIGDNSNLLLELAKPTRAL